VVDPTGAGDSFVGGMIGYLASCKGPFHRHLRRAIVHGTVMGSFCCEVFGLKRTADMKRERIDQRLKEFEALLRV